MTIEEAEKLINVLKGKLRRIRSEKLRSFYMADILTLENYIHTYKPSYSCGISVKDFDYIKYRNRLLKEKEKRVNEILAGNELNGMIASHVISEYEEAKFEIFIADDPLEQNEKQLREAFRDFMGSLGTATYKKYNELIESDAIVFAPIANYGGVCWDFPVLNRQVVMCEDRFGLYSYLAIAHEIGHAVHFNAWNGVGRNRFEVSTFGESMSTLYEKLYMNYMEKCGFDVFALKNFVYSQKLGEAIAVKLAQAGVSLGYGIFNGYDVVFDDFTLEEAGLTDIPYQELYEKLKTDLEYSQPLYYLIGEATACLMLDRNNQDATSSIDDMLDFLLRSEKNSHSKNIQELGLSTYDFSGYALELKKYGTRPQK